METNNSVLTEAVSGNTNDEVEIIIEDENESTENTETTENSENTDGTVSEDNTEATETTETVTDEEEDPDPLNTKQLPAAGWIKKLRENTKKVNRALREREEHIKQQEEIISHIASRLPTEDDEKPPKLSDFDDSDYHYDTDRKQEAYDKAKASYDSKVLAKQKAKLAADNARAKLEERLKHSRDHYSKSVEVGKHKREKIEQYGAVLEQVLTPNQSVWLLQSCAEYKISTANVITALAKSDPKHLQNLANSVDPISFSRKVYEISTKLKAPTKQATVNTIKQAASKTSAPTSTSNLAKLEQLFNDDKISFADYQKRKLEIKRQK